MTASYTVQVLGRNDETGIALVEVYQLPNTIRP